MWFILEMTADSNNRRDFLHRLIKKCLNLILNARKKFSIYTHQINLRKTFLLFPLPTNLSLNPLTHITNEPTTRPLLKQAFILFHAKIVTNITLAKINAIKKKKKKKKRIYEHKRSIKTHDDRNALFSYMLDLKHTFNFSQITLIKFIHYKKCRSLLESAVISKTNHLKQWPRLYKISPYLLKCRKLKKC